MGLAVLCVVLGVVWAGSLLGSKGSADGPAAPSAALSPTAGGNGATTTTTGGTAGTAAQASQNGPKNLLPDPSFEAGWEGWRPLGGARLARSTEAKEGGWSLRITADPAAPGPIGVTVPNVTLTKGNGRYHTNAWVRPSAPGTTVTIGLREYRGGRPVPGSNTLGWTVEGSGWRRFGAIHVASQSGSRLALEIMARDLPPGGFLDIDEVVLHLLGSQ